MHERRGSLPQCTEPELVLRECGSHPALGPARCVPGSTGRDFSEPPPAYLTNEDECARHRRDVPVAPDDAGHGGP